MVRPDKPRRHCERSGALVARLARKRAVLVRAGVCAKRTAGVDVAVSCDLARKFACWLTANAAKSPGFNWPGE